MVDPFSRRQIIALASRALRDADVVGVLPTPLTQVARVVGVAETIDIGDIPDDLNIKKPSGLKRILGAYTFRSNTAFVDLSQPRGRKRFIMAHETGHKLIPWHEASFHFDDEMRLFRDTEEELEEEASFAGTLLIFQGGHFHTKALDYANSIRTPILLSDEFGASYHATIHFYTEHHPEPMALVIAGRHKRMDGTVPIFKTVESRLWLERFGPLRAYFDRGVSIRSADDAISEVATAAFRAPDPVTGHVRLKDRSGRSVRCQIDGFYNQRCLFLLVSPRGILPRGQRVTVKAG